MDEIADGIVDSEFCAYCEVYFEYNELRFEFDGVDYNIQTIFHKDYCICNDCKE